jgi:hypothetical protein
LAAKRNADRIHSGILQAQSLISSSLLSALAILEATLADSPLFAFVLESCERHPYPRVGALQAILGYVVEANHCIANLDLRVDPLV